jgi:hypothetical protein
MSWLIMSWLIVMLCAPLAGAQQPPAAPPAQTPAATFRTTTRLIVQTVSVKDKDGHPIEGLTTKDFTVT